MQGVTLKRNTVICFGIEHVCDCSLVNVFKKNGIDLTRDCFTSVDDNVLKPMGFNFKVL